MKGKFNVVNLLLIVVLVSFTVFHWVTDNSNIETIDEYSNSIRLQQDSIDNLTILNKSIDSTLVILNDTINRLKYEIILYDDSLIKINEDHDEAIKEIDALTDSLSVVKFRSYTSKHGARFGYDFDR